MLFKKNTNDLNSRFHRRSATGLSMAIAALVLPAISNAGGFNIPTDMPKSPLCIAGKCATEFSQPLIQFEEFGTESMDSSSTSSHSLTDFPAPVADAKDPTAVCRNAPDGDALDDFLDHDLFRAATEDSNEIDLSPWQAQIQFCVGATRTPTEGRPPNVWFAHQRFAEFSPKSYFQTAMAPSRKNGGLRDKKQLHKYEKGEFGPGGLYYLDANGDGKPGSKGVEIKFHPNLPTQLPTSIWTFDGTLPPKLLMARYGESLLFRHYNALPIDIAHNGGFGTHTISTHEHNGHNPAESDGFIHAYFYPGQYYDYHWPMILAGHDSINTGATDPRTGAPDGNGGINYVPGDWRETASTHWFHDHMLDFTAQNVYKGNAAMMNIYSAVDRGREPASANEALTGKVDSSGSDNPGYGCHYANPDNVNLCFPSGSDLDWGNRSYDMNLVVADKAWDQNGQLAFNIFNTNGFLADRATVNFVYKPTVDVRARKYRLRILNGSVSRFMKMGLVTAAGKVVPSYMVANDGNIMEHAVKFPRSESEQGMWPEQAIAERFDIVADFKPYVGQTLYLVNLMEFSSSLKSNRIVPVADVISGRYNPEANDPMVGKIMKINVVSCAKTTENPTGACQDFSMNPDDYVAGKKKMIPLNKPTQAELQAATQRSFRFAKGGATDLTPWAIQTDGGAALNADPHRVSAAPELPANPVEPGKVEIWHIRGDNSWNHPVHIHFEEGQILKRGGVTPPEWEKWARKDIYRVGPYKDSKDSVDVAIRFREFAGTYVEHCHNTQHEDKAMLLRWDNERPGQTLAIPAPMPEWNGVVYEPSERLPTAETGDLKAKQQFVLP
jgi:FtsP/CotA-like multicopper oxidase with cupredoxin domain